MQRINAYRHLSVVFLAAGSMMGGCSLSGSSGIASDFGATQGGVQDMGFARELIDVGQVPPPEAFVVEGMFSEHDLGLAGDACPRTLCLRQATGIAPTLDGDPRCWLQIGLSSSIDMDAFRRPDLTVIACIDVSGSMGWEYTPGEREFPTPGEVTRNLLSGIAAELSDADRIAIVTYGTTVDTVLPITSGDDQRTIQAIIDSLSTGGVTNMDGGLRRAFEIARETEAAASQVRVMLFTDVQPNVGATEATEFEQIVGQGAADGVGLTVFGVGVGMRQELFNAISHLRGGNAFTLFDNDDVMELMADDWPWLVSPIAYELSVTVAPGEGFAGREAYGFPGGADQEGPRLVAATVFLSRRKGALLVGFEPVGETALTSIALTGELNYDTPDGEAIVELIDTDLADAVVDDRGQFFEQDSVRKSVALALLTSGMATSAEQYATERETAIATLQAVIQRFSADLEGTNDPEVAAELALASRLLALMEEGATQGDLYGLGQF